MNKKTKKIFTIIIIMLFIIGLSLSSFLYFSGLSLEKFFINLNINIYIKICIVFMIYFFRNYLFIPSTFIILFAGFFLQNFLVTLIISIIGVGIGICQTYFVGYVFGDDFKKNNNFTLINKYNEKIKSDGLKVIFLGAFFPIIPVDILYYSAGILKYNFIKTFFAGILGELPLILLYVYLGKEAQKYSHYLFYIILGMGIIYIGYLSMKKNKKSSQC